MFYNQTIQSEKERREFSRFVAKECSFGHQSGFGSIDCTSAIKSLTAFGMNVFDWRKNIFSNTAAGSSKASCKSKRKRKFHLHSQSIQAVCHQYLFARTSHNTPSSKDILLVSLQEKEIHTSTQNGRKTVSKCMKTEKSNSRWAFISENEKSRSSCMCRICQTERSKKSNAATDCVRKK
jgi:hypothetical protein